MLTKNKNQLKEYEKRLNRIETYINKYEQYALQNSRITKQLRKWKEPNSEGKLVWKKNVRFTVGENDNEYDKVSFTYPKPKMYILSRDRLRTVENRLKHERNYLSFLERKIKNNKY
jgi:hypothetical protein